MPFENITLFPGLLADSAAKLAQDAAGRYPERCSATMIREMGWNGLLIAEAQGGVGGGFSDLASILEALAVNAVDLPVITRCGIVPAMLNALPDSEGARTLLTAIADGTVVVELGSEPDLCERSESLVARKDEKGWQISGTTTGITLSDDCTHVLLVCRSADNGDVMLVNVDAEALQSHATDFRTMDDRHVSLCALKDISVPADRVMATGEVAEHAIQAGWQVAVFGVATDTVCCMGSALARTIAYLLERQQFGQPLAHFQALRHDVARLYVVYELARNLLQASMRALEGTQRGEDVSVAFDLLGLYVSEESVQFAESVIQLHGGMGMTREMPAARLATRMLANALRFGDSLTHYQSLHELRDAHEASCQVQRPGEVQQ